MFDKMLGSSLKSDVLLYHTCCRCNNVFDNIFLLYGYIKEVHQQEKIIKTGDSSSMPNRTEIEPPPNYLQSGEVEFIKLL